MNKRELFDQVTNMETQIGELYEQLGNLKDYIGQLIEENHRLSVENTNLRNYLDHEKETSEAESAINVPGEGVDNLARIYKEGFHICHMEFGSPRSQEDCIFCLDLIADKTNHQI